jgi:hypothetical protein
VGVVGGLRLAQILALRGAAVGARVIVETARQELWDPLLLDSGLDAARLAIQPVGRVTGNPGWAPPSPAAPILVVRDCGARPPYATTPRGPWTTILTLLPYLDVRAAGQLATADLVGLQRMSAEEAGVARQAVGLSDKDTLALPELPESMALWRVRGRAGRYCEVTATAWEERIVADPVPARATASPAR